MVEPAASIVFNTLLQGRSTLGSPSAIYSVSRVMARPARISLTPGFFNPQPRRVKGKERMSDPSRPDVLSVYSARCQDWSCRMRISVWCSGEPDKAEAEETRSRTRTARRTRKPAYAIPRHDRAILPPALHRGQTRHASHSSERPFPDSDPPSSNSDTPSLDPPIETAAVSDNGSLQSSELSPDDLDLPPEGPDPSSPLVLDPISETDTPPPAALPTAESKVAEVPLPPPISNVVKQSAVRYLQDLIVERKEHFKLEKTWHAYETVQIYGELSKLTLEEGFALAEKILDFVERRYQTDNLDELHKWGGRVRQILEPLGSTSTQTERNLAARALALEGELQYALDIIHSDRPFYEDSAPFLGVYESVFVSIWRHHDRVRALEFLILEWDIIGSCLITETSRTHTGPIGAASTSLREKAFAIVSGISLPAIVLADKEFSWDRQRRKQMGDFLIEAFFRAKLPMESVDVLREMNRQHLQPAQHLPLHLVRALARDDLYDDAHTLFSSFDKETPNYDYLFTGLYLYAHEGKAEEATEYFNRITEAGWRNSKVVLQLMYAYAVQGQTEKTLEVFQEYFPVDYAGIPTNSPLVEHFAVGVFAHAQRGDFSGTIPWLEAMRKCGLQPETYVFTTVLKSFALRGELDPIASLLDEMRTAGYPPNVVTYTTVMTLLAHRKDPASTEAIYARAIKDGVVPDSMMIATLMNAHIEAGSWKGVIRAFDFIRTSPHMKLTIGIYNLLLKAYIQIGAPFRIVSRVFNRLERLRVRPDAYTFALLIQSACDSRQMDTAADIFIEMERLSEYWGSSRHITTWSMTIIMAGFLRKGDKEQATAVYQDMVERGLKPTAVTYGVIINSYGREGTEESFKLAEEFIKDLTELPQEARTWETPPHGRLSARDHLYLPLMQAYSSLHKPEEIERVLHQMFQDGGEPTLSILSTLLDAYARVKDIDSILKLWPQIFQLGVKYSTIPLFANASEDQQSSRMHTFVLCLPLSRYITALSHAGLHEEIAKVWKAFQAHGFSFSADNWNQLALALITAGEVERCFEVLEKVLIPYHRRSNRLRQEERDLHPNSPLSFNVLPSEQRPLERPLVGKARSQATRWSRYHQRAKEELGQPQLADDLAYHLYVLHRISPMWNTWQPRHDVLRKLFETLLRLRAGYPADAETRVDELSMDPEELARQMDDAAGRLRALYLTYPDAVGLVKQFERRERRRLGRWFTKVYSWAPSG
ncbi:hypothetical protein C8R43DRAFT_1142350 [Mycena crocata]|nr:hypothetical protein C8R43DRAFT_1142350 [Mycena crocata]